MPVLLAVVLVAASVVNPDQRGPDPTVESLTALTGPYPVSTLEVPPTEVTGFGGADIYLPDTTDQSTRLRRDQHRHARTRGLTPQTGGRTRGRLPGRRDVMESFPPPAVCMIVSDAVQQEVVRHTGGAMSFDPIEVRLPDGGSAAAWVSVQR